ncbi:M67 family metallopeptidase [soil metagenome]
MTSLKLPDHHREAIIQHARDEAPRECCGVIGGREGVLTTFHRVTNRAEGNRLYMMDDEELYAVTRELTNRNEDPLVIYHSHPESPAHPSKTDVEMAFYPDSFYVICSLENLAEPYLRAFTIVDEHIEEVAIGNG